MGYREFQASIAWDREISVFVNGIKRAEIDYLNRGIERIALKFAPQIESWMKANAPWTDRTGNARQGLYAEVEQLITDMVSIVIGGRVSYTYWLEVANQGKYAVIAPALDFWYGKVFDAVQRFIDTGRV